VTVTVYRRALFLPDALRRAGLTVREEPGWQTRGRPPSSGSFDPRAFLLHHDASASGSSVPAGKDLVRDGRPGLAGPLSQIYYSFGIFYVLAAGRANHAGTGPGWGVVGRDLGNALAIGCEWDHTSGEPVSPSELADLTRGAAAILDALGADPYRAAFGHREYAPGRKIDPAGVDLDSWRDGIAAQIAELRAARNAPSRPPSAPSSRKAERMTIYRTADNSRALALFVPGLTFEPISNTERTVLLKGGTAEAVVTAKEWDAAERLAQRLAER
jgi:hypothetical protein